MSKETVYGRRNTRRTHRLPAMQTLEFDERWEARMGSERLLAAQIRANQVMPVAMARWQAKHGVSA